MPFVRLHKFCLDYKWHASGNENSEDPRKNTFAALAAVGAATQAERDRSVVIMGLHGLDAKLSTIELSGRRGHQRWPDQRGGKERLVDKIQPHGSCFIRRGLVTSRHRGRHSWRSFP